MQAVDNVDCGAGAAGAQYQLLERVSDRGASASRACWAHTRLGIAITTHVHTLQVTHTVQMILNPYRERRQSSVHGCAPAGKHGPHACSVAQMHTTRTHNPAARVNLANVSTCYPSIVKRPVLKDTLAEHVFHFV
eukprot:19581-Heterococcus_DN1.PRE.4